MERVARKTIILFVVISHQGAAVRRLDIVAILQPTVEMDVKVDPVLV